MDGLDDSIAEAIRPAGNYSDTVYRVRKVQYKSKAKVRKQMEVLGIQMLQSTADPNLCVLEI